MDTWNHTCGFLPFHLLWDENECYVPDVYITLYNWIDILMKRVENVLHDCDCEMCDPKD